MKSKITTVLFLLILAIAAFFRFYQLADIPPGLYPDVAMNGTNALDANQTGVYKVFYPENNGREGMFMNLIAVSFLIFGPNVWAIKIVAAIFGILTVLGMFLLTRNLFKFLLPDHLIANSDSSSGTEQPNHSLLFNQSFVKESPPALLKNLHSLTITTADIIALLATFFTAISFWHVNFSRLGFRAITVPFCLVWSFYFLFSGLQITLNQSSSSANKDLSSFGKKTAGKILFFLFAGLFFGLGFNTYIAFRVAPLILIPVFIIDIIKNRRALKMTLARWVIFAVGVIAAALPLALYYLKNPADFMGRAGQVSIFATQNPLKTLFTSTIKTLGQFVVAGDYNWRHNISGSPEIFWPLIPFFIIGLFYSFWQILKKKNYQTKNFGSLACYWTIIFWWGTMLIPSIFSNEGLPHALRSIGAIPPSYIFVAVGFWLFISFIRQKIIVSKNPKGLLIAYFLVFISLLVLAGVEYYRYFIFWGQNPETKGAMTQKFVDEANYLNSLSPNIKKYVIVNEGGVPVPYPDGIPMPAQTIMFLTRAKNPEVKITYLKPEMLLAESRSACEQIAADSLNQPVIVLPMAKDQTIFNLLSSEIPNGQVEAEAGGEFSVFKINF